MKAGKITCSNATLSDELNAFYACFKQELCESMSSTLETSDVPESEITIADVRAAFSKVNPWKATGPDEVSG